MLIYDQVKGLGITESEVDDFNEGIDRLYWAVETLHVLSCLPRDPANSMETNYDIDQEVVLSLANRLNIAVNVATSNIDSISASIGEEVKS